MTAEDEVDEVTENVAENSTANAPADEVADASPTADSAAAVDESTGDDVDGSGAQPGAEGSAGEGADDDADGSDASGDGDTAEDSAEDDTESKPRELTKAERARLAAQQAREDDPRAREPVMVSAVEAILFASEGPVRTSDIIAVVEKVEKRPVHESVVHTALEEYARELAERGSAIVPTPVANGWELRTQPDVGEYVRTMYERKPVKLSRAALEVLSIVAYRQPCTRADVDDIRGVDCSSSLRQLCQRDLVRIIGRADDLGRPLIYGTTREFLRFFGLEKLSDLPTLKEFAELSEEHLVTLAEMDDENARMDAEQQRQVAEDEPEEGSAFVEDDGESAGAAVAEEAGTDTVGGEEYVDDAAVDAETADTDNEEL